MKLKEIIRLIPPSGVAVLLVAGVAMAEPLPGGTLNLQNLPKFVSPLVRPGKMPKSPAPGGFTGDYYEIAVRQFEQQVLPAPLPQTTVWGYGSVNHEETFNYPAYTIEARHEKPVRVK